MIDNGSAKPTQARVRYEEPAEGIARITLARPDKANAQDYRMLSELNAALEQASRTPHIRAIIVAADGVHFSSGHDLSEPDADMRDFPVVGLSANFDAGGAEGYMDREREVYLDYCRRWRDIPKPTIAQVQGRVVAGGLMLVWPMDLIVCADNASFCDPVLTFGANGVEFFVHPYELGHRLAKDMLFTGRQISAQEAMHHGMVSRIFPVDQLEAETLQLAVAIAQRPSMTLALTKRSVNLAQDAMGFNQTLEAAFAMHHLLHSHFEHTDGFRAVKGSDVAVRQLLREGPVPGIPHYAETQRVPDGEVASDRPPMPAG